MIKKLQILILLIVSSHLATAQIQNQYPYQNPEWIYMARTIDWFQNPPDTGYYLYTCKSYGDTVRNNKHYMQVANVPHFGSDYFYYRKSSDSLFQTLFTSNDSTDYLVGNYNAAVGDTMSASDDTVSQISTVTLLNSQSKKLFYTAKSWWNDTLIEDLGSTIYPVYQMAFTTIVPTYTLICFKDGNTVLHNIPMTVTSYSNTTVTNPCTAQAIGIKQNQVKEFLVSYESTGNLHITNNSYEENYTLEILNLNGQVLSQTIMDQYNASVRLPDLSAGMYFYVIRNRYVTEKGKLLIH